MCVYAYAYIYIYAYIYTHTVSLSTLHYTMLRRGECFWHIPPACLKGLRRKLSESNQWAMKPIERSASTFSPPRRDPYNQESRAIPMLRICSGQAHRVAESACWRKQGHKVRRSCRRRRRQRLTASRRGQDKRDRRRSAAIPHNRLSLGNMSEMLEHIIATCGKLWQNIAKRKRFVALL